MVEKSHDSALSNSSHRVLFIDDDKFGRRRLLRLLSELFDVVVFDYPGDALDFLQREPCSVVVFDIPIHSFEPIDSPVSEPSEEAGVQFADTLNKRWPDISLAVRLLHANRKSEIAATFEFRGIKNFRLIDKRHDAELLRAIEELLLPTVEFASRSTEVSGDRENAADSERPENIRRSFLPTAELAARFGQLEDDVWRIRAGLPAMIWRLLPHPLRALSARQGMFVSRLDLHAGYMPRWLRKRSIPHLQVSISEKLLDVICIAKQFLRSGEDFELLSRRHRSSVFVDEIQINFARQLNLEDYLVADDRRFAELSVELQSLLVDLKDEFADWVENNPELGRQYGLRYNRETRSVSLLGPEDDGTL